jgi:oligoendopeptidase F
MENARQFFHQLNRDYLLVHKTKEDLFWSTYMATSNDHAGFAQAEQAYKEFISAPAKLAATRTHLATVEAAPASPERDALLHGLRGWLALFESNIVDSDQGRALMRELIDAEATLFAEKQKMVARHLNEQGQLEEASLPMLGTNMSLNPVEERRKSSFEALREVEHWVLQHGFLNIVRLRNRYARALGFNNYFDYKVRKNEQMSPQALFAILDDFEARTREANYRALDNLAAAKGASALAPWNIRFHQNGDVVRRMDPYLPFAKGLARWVESFRRLGIVYRGATMQLDLLEREGKYQNGFCHGPIPTFYDENGAWVAGQINFTAGAKPDQVGSGLRAINTLFHEGGHAAHFANVTQNSPCFSQEFAPTSMAYAETQSMFCDSLLDDADWLKRYAKNDAGETIPDALIEARIATSQPFRAFAERSNAVVSYFESALYQMDDAALTPEAVLALARATEIRILGMESPRPLLSVPHLLNQESAAAYHGYLLANMAVYQTRSYFLRRFGYLTDNPAIGPLLAQHYWAPGNSINHNATLQSLTGEGFSAKYLADDCNMSTAQAWQQAQSSIAAAQTRAYPQEYPRTLDATIRIVHGGQVLADNSASEEAMCMDFEHWVERKYPASLPNSVIPA